MAYGNYGNQGGGYQKQGGYQNNNGGGYQRQQQSAPPAKPPVDIEQEAQTYATIFQTLTAVLTASGVELDQVHDFLGGWVSGIKIKFDRG